MLLCILTLTAVSNAQEKNKKQTKEPMRKTTFQQKPLQSKVDSVYLKEQDRQIEKLDSLIKEKNK